MADQDRIYISIIKGYFGVLANEIREALEGDSNDAEHDALVSAADALGIDYDPDKAS